MTLVGAIELPACARRRSLCTCNVDPRTSSLGSVEGRVYPSGTGRGKLKNVEIDLSVRVGHAAVRECACGRYGIRAPTVLSAVLSAGRAARHRSRTASLQW